MSLKLIGPKDFTQDCVLENSLEKSTSHWNFVNASSKANSCPSEVVKISGKDQRFTWNYPCCHTLNTSTLGPFYEGLHVSETVRGVPSLISATFLACGISVAFSTSVALVYRTKGQLYFVLKVRNAPPSFC